jgi:hypothetical protein
MWWYMSKYQDFGAFQSIELIDNLHVKQFLIWAKKVNFRKELIKRQFFSMSRICNEKCSKPKIFLAFLSKLLCFSFIL